MIPKNVRMALEAILDRNNTKHTYSGREVRVWLVSQPQIPKPDWERAPDWAEWWAVSADGYAYWYKNKPSRQMHSFSWHGWGMSGRYNGQIVLPIGIDWRQTLQRQPQREVV